MPDGLMTAQLLIFDTFTHAVVILACYVMYRKTKYLFSLSLEKGIKYFRNAFLFYTWCFIFRYTMVILELTGYFQNEPEIASILHPTLMFLTLYTASIGGFYLAYSLMWRKFEPWFQKKHGFILSHMTAIAIATAEVYLTFTLNILTNYIFFTVMIVIMLSALHYSRHRREKKDVSLNPYISVIGLGFGVYTALFTESLLASILPTIHFYVWAIVAIFVITAAYNVTQLSR